MTAFTIIEKKALTISIYPTETWDSMQMKLITVTITLSGVAPWLIGKIIFCFFITHDIFSSSLSDPEISYLQSVILSL